MRSIFTATILLLCSSCVSAHELTDSFPDNMQVILQTASVTVEYCPDNTCDSFTIDDPAGSEIPQDSVLGRYSAHCPQEPVARAARCIVMYLIDKHPIRTSFVRHDEGKRNVVPIAPEDFSHGT